MEIWDENFKAHINICVQYYQLRKVIFSVELPNLRYVQIQENINRICCLMYIFGVTDTTTPNEACMIISMHLLCTQNI